MKKVFMSLVVLLSGIVAAMADPQISFESIVHDFGTFPEESGRVSTEFVFTNTGDADLVLQKVRASCGCTTPDWTKAPVKPGEKGSIKVTYNASGRPGSFNKTITVSSNAGEKRLSIKGDDLWKRVGREPSGTAFNSLVQLEIEKGVPRNPFINAGAIVMADILLSHLDNPKEDFLNFVRAVAGNQTIEYNENVAVSERENGYLNAAIANLLKYHGTIKNDIESVLHFYFLMCSVEMSCRELSLAFLAFANHRRKFDYTGITLTASQIKRMNAIMQTCGFYDEAGEFAFFVGLPGKSGVGGGIVAIYPLQYSVAVWSPRLNSKGNSVMGMKALELLTTETKESIF